MSTVLSLLLMSSSWCLADEEEAVVRQAMLDRRVDSKLKKEKKRTRDCGDGSSSTHDGGDDAKQALGGEGLSSSCCLIC